MLSIRKLIAESLRRATGDLTDQVSLVQQHDNANDAERIMKDENGRGVIRLNDKTTHGGHVITASDDLKAQGIPVALEGHLTECPKCGGQFRIIPQSSTRNHHGTPVAFHDDLTECGARLISSLE